MYNVGPGQAADKTSRRKHTANSDDRRNARPTLRLAREASLDRRADQVAPLGPRAVVVTHVGLAE
jgi:hypothetical protein